MPILIQGPPPFEPPGEIVLKATAGGRKLLAVGYAGVTLAHRRPLARVGHGFASGVSSPANRNLELASVPSDFLAVAYRTFFPERMPSADDNVPVSAYRPRTGCFAEPQTNVFAV